MTTIYHTKMSPCGDAWTSDCIGYWSQATAFWARYQELPGARNCLYRAYNALGEHLHTLMRADTRADY